MAKNSLNEILKKEKETEEKLSAIKDEYEIKINIAKVEAKKLENDIVNKAKKSSEELLAKVNEDIEGLYENANTEAQKVTEDILNKYSNIKDDAFKIITSIILGG